MLAVILIPMQSDSLGTAPLSSLSSFPDLIMFSSRSRKSGYERRKHAFFFYYSTAACEILERWLMLCNKPPRHTLVLTVSCPECRHAVRHEHDGSMSIRSLSVTWYLHTLTHLLFSGCRQADQEQDWQAWGALWSFLGQFQRQNNVLKVYYGISETGLIQILKQKMSAITDMVANIVIFLHWIKNKHSRCGFCTNMTLQRYLEGFFNK